MSRTVEVTRAEVQRERAAAGPARRTRVILRKVGPWSVFKFSLLFYFCVMLVVLLGLTVLYNILGALGVLDHTTKFIGELLGEKKTFRIDGGWLFTRAFAVGLIMVVFWSVVKLLVTVMYNLISDLVGGVEVTLGERR